MLNSYSRVFSHHVIRIWANRFKLAKLKMFDPKRRTKDLKLIHLQFSQIKQFHVRLIFRCSKKNFENELHQFWTDTIIYGICTIIYACLWISNNKNNQIVTCAPWTAQLILQGCYASGKLGKVREFCETGILREYCKFKKNFQEIFDFWLTMMIFSWRFHLLTVNQSHTRKCRRSSKNSTKLS